MSIENLKTYGKSQSSTAPQSPTVPDSPKRPSKLTAYFTDPFAEADEDNGGETKHSTAKVHIRIQRMSTICFTVACLNSTALSPIIFKSDRLLSKHPPPLSAHANDLHTERNGRKTLTTIQGIPEKFSRKKILSKVKKDFG